MTTSKESAPIPVESLLLHRRILAVQSILRQEFRNLSPEDFIMGCAERIAHAENGKFKDPLTGLPTIQLGRMILGHEIERSRRYDQPLAVMMIDLDGFKDINRQGYQRGDRAIQITANHLQSHSRASDVVCRYWRGDEL